MTDSFFRDEPKDREVRSVPELNPGSGDLNSSKRGTESGFSSDREFSSEGGFTTEEGRMAAIMSYIPVLCFIPLLNMRDNKEAHFHARQGMILFLIELIAVIFLIDGVSGLVFKGLLLIALGLSCAGIYFALQGRNYRLPVVSDLAEKSKRYTEPVNPPDDQKTSE
ncbi:MAG: hypothetical protein P1R58_02255 [bacterium]|nr:hypothetical protein [bacterium]